MTETQNDFINNAALHQEAIQKGDDRTANKIHFKLMATYKLLRDSDDLDQLKDLCKYPDESVQLWAATFSLKSDPNMAMSLLSELTKSKGIVGFMASTTIDLWKKNMLAL